MTKYNWQIINDTMIEFDYDPKNGRKKDWFSFILPNNNTDKGKYINDAFKWWQLYQPYFKDGWNDAITGKPPMMTFKFDGTTYKIYNKKYNVIRFIKNLQKLPASFFKDKTWYDTLTGMPRMLYTPMMREAA